MQRAQSFNWFVADRSLHIHIPKYARLQRFSPKQIYFRTPKYNGPRNSRHFSEQLWKLIRFYFGNLDTYCLPAILLLFHSSRSFFRVPFLLVTHCQKHARNEISITFFIPSRTYIHFNFTSILWFFPFFPLSCFTSICSVLIVETIMKADVVWCRRRTWFLEKMI